MLEELESKSTYTMWYSAKIPNDGREAETWEYELVYVGNVTEDNNSFKN